MATHDGNWIPVEGLLDTGEIETVYNLRVADYHTYFVGCYEWRFDVWAHNTYNGSAAARTAALKQTFSDVNLPEIPGVNFKGMSPADVAKMMPEMEPIFIRRGGRTISLTNMAGILVDPQTGKGYAIMSGWTRKTMEHGSAVFRSGNISRKTAREAGEVWQDLGSHLEPQAAAFMRRHGIENGALHISGSIPCGRGRGGCFDMLPEMLGPGTTLDVFTSAKRVNHYPFTGLPD